MTSTSLDEFERTIEKINASHVRKVRSIMFWYRMRLLLIWAIFLSPLWVHFVWWAWKGFPVVGGH